MKKILPPPKPGTPTPLDQIDKNFKVSIRVRPPLKRELLNGFVNVVKVSPDHNAITISENISSDPTQDGLYSTHVFTFDYVYDMDGKQIEVYNNIAKDAVLSTLEGYNATMIAYGQTGTGKTYTMEGFTNEEERGIIPRATEDIFNYIQNCPNSKTKFLVRASYLQIYNEVVSDLLKPERTHLNIREDKKRGVFVERLSEWVVRSPAEIYGLMERGAQIRKTASTKMNELSSRSHAVFIIIVEQAEILETPSSPTGSDNQEPSDEDIEEGDDDARSEFSNQGAKYHNCRIGKLNLVDLAGSERVRFSGATGVRLDESRQINKSLSCLGNVISALTDKKGRQHIPYRDSKLTRLLEDSLGGNCKTTLMAMISPALESIQETHSTLKFANRAKQIKNTAKINEDIDQRALLRRYEKELKRLREELTQKTQNVVDKGKLLELEEQKRKAEQDKLAAINALEKRSREFIQEKVAKRKLEQKILMMQSQLLVGGEKIEETPAFRKLLKQEYQRIQKQYQNKLQELEKERETIEEDKVQVDRYKQLLLKQRDIMIALTARLNERDESILALQEELDAYDRHQRMLEEALDQKTAALIQIQQQQPQLNLDKVINSGKVLSSNGNYNFNFNSSGSNNNENNGDPYSSSYNNNNFDPMQQNNSPKSQQQQQLPTPSSSSSFAFSSASNSAILQQQQLGQALKEKDQHIGDLESEVNEMKEEKRRYMLEVRKLREELNGFYKMKSLVTKMKNKSSTNGV